MSDVAAREHDLLRLPSVPPPPVRAPVPVLAAIVPVVGALVLWRVTGSTYALWFAALGPLLAVASFGDGLRAARRARHAARRAARGELTRLGREVETRHAEERARAWGRTPDVAALCGDDAEIWRAVPGRESCLVVGRGAGVSGLRIEGDAADEAARALRRRAREIEDVPVTIPLDAGIAVRGPAVLAASVARALLLQVCLVHPPGRVRVADPAALSTVLAVAGELPHAHATAGAAVVVTDAAARVPAGADIPIVVIGEDDPVPPRCAAVLTLAGGHRGRLDHDGNTRSVQVEAVSAAQAAEIASALAARAHGLGHRADEATTVDDLAVDEPRPGSLRCPLGVSAGEVVSLDLVTDGPHAVVIGTTGSGKSELLCTWAAGMCRGRDATEVALLLVDFKGGRAFDALAALPHVTGVLTDLDEQAAVRAVESLRAEIRHRERTLAAHAAKDIDEAVGALPRLVIVVDEYAALINAHPELHELFADVAARGRALGMHLVLASQRATGAFRDAVLANAPLRIALRTTDAADSRLVLGTDDAVRLSGRPEGRGIARIRGAADDEPRRLRVARCTARALEAIRVAAGAQRARAPWLPPLAASVPLERVARPGRIVLGLADEPDRQRQEAVVLPEDAAGLAVVGAAASGRTGVLRTVARQLRVAPLWVPADAEGAWDAVDVLLRSATGGAVLIDDLDALVGRFSAEYAVEFVARLERIVRDARRAGRLVVVSAARISGPSARIIELLPHRALLSLATRADHVAAGGDSAHFLSDQPVGRGRWGRLLVQFAHTDAPVMPAPGPAPPVWSPAGAVGGVTAVVAGPGADPRGLAAACAARGARLLTVAEAAASDLIDPAAAPPGAPRETLVVHGAADEWLAQWRLLARVRSAHELLIGAECLPEFRAVTGRRELPPFAASAAGRAWRVVPGRECVRVRLPPGRRSDGRADASHLAAPAGDLEGELRHRGGGVLRGQGADAGEQ